MQANISFAGSTSEGTCSYIVALHRDRILKCFMWNHVCRDKKFKIKYLKPCTFCLLNLFCSKLAW